MGNSCRVKLTRSGKFGRPLSSAGGAFDGFTAGALLAQTPAMAVSIKTNVSSLDAQRNLMGTVLELDSSIAKLSSGFRITKAQDDAAGLAISVNLAAQIKSYNQSVRNASDALNVVTTADASLNEAQN